jgi:BCD family chlorophyll transporter-like MFS transporter
MVDPYTPQALERAFWTIGMAALVLGALGLIKLEPRSTEEATIAAESYSWRVLFGVVFENRQARLFFWYLVILLAAILGQDILLEPFGGEAFGMSVKETTRITSLWGVCVLIALIVAGLLETRVNKKTVARWGAWMALLGFILIALSGVMANQVVFYTGVASLGIGTGLATVSNLSLMLDMTTADKVGLFIGAWGMANALSRLIGTVLGGVVRDMVTQLAQTPVMGYIVVFGIEAIMLVVSLILLRYIDVGAFRQRVEEKPSIIERAAMASDV